MEVLREQHRQEELPDLVPVVYIIEAADVRRLTGVITLRDLILASPQTRLVDIMVAEPITA